MLKSLAKLLFLLQLEEYDTSLTIKWLEKYDLEKLEQRKKRLKFTFRIYLTFIFLLPFYFLLGPKKAIGIINPVVSLLFKAITSLLTFLAQVKLSFYPNLTKIVITGSYGKTTFKEMLSLVLSTKYQVLKTEGNINTDIGIALTILKRLNRQTEIFIVEAGAYQKGEIKKICQFIKPQFGVITIFGLMHLERFGSFEAIKKAKMELKDYIKEKEKMFLPDKDNQFLDFSKTTLEIAQQLGISAMAARKRLVSFAPPKHRLSVQKINKQMVILDDAYNSNPEGFKKAINELKKWKNWQKIVITPGMIEFGSRQFDLNQKLASEAASVADIFVIVGQTNREALEKGISENNKGRNKLKILFLEKDKMFQEKIMPYLKPPTVILLENDLPDHYF